MPFSAVTLGIGQRRLPLVQKSRNVRPICFANLPDMFCELGGDLMRTPFLFQAGGKSRQTFCHILIVFLLVVPAMAFAQGYYGTISGVLTDPTGAVIPDAKVTLLDQEKGYKVNVTSDGTGRYLF